MIDRGPDDWQSERHVDCAAKRHELDRNQSLVVIAGHHRVELTAHGAHEYRIRRKWSADVDPSGPLSVDRGRENVVVLTANDTMLPGVGIQTSDAKPRP